MTATLDAKPTTKKPWLKIHSAGHIVYNLNFGAMFSADKADKMMVRKHFRITRRQDMLIKRIAKMRGVSEAEIIRRAIERETSREPISETPEANSVLAERKEPLDTSLE